MYAKCHTKMIFKRPQDFGWSFVLFCTFLSKEISSTYKYEVSIKFWLFKKSWKTFGDEKYRKCKYLTRDSSIRNSKTGTEKTRAPALRSSIKTRPWIIRDGLSIKNPGQGCMLIIHSSLRCSIIWNLRIPLTIAQTVRLEKKSKKINRYNRSSSQYVTRLLVMNQV